MRLAVVFVLSGCSAVLGIEDFSIAIDGGRDGNGNEMSATGLCVGPGNWRVCAPSVPMTPRIVMTATMIDTDTDGACAMEQPPGWTNTQPPACFVFASDITITAPLRAHGVRPLVLFAAKAIKISAGGVDVAGHASVTQRAAGANAMECTAPGAALNGAGGGAGGSFRYAGGNGGLPTTGTIPGMAAAPDSVPPPRLRGGCAGGVGGTGGSVIGGSAGQGGGVVYLVANETINITNTAINASGGPGGGASSPAGGGGGGSGGMIVLFAPTISGVGGKLIANGGGGGGGGGGNVAGQVGKEASTTDPWAAPQGGSGGSVGGDGGAGFAVSGSALSGMNATTGGGSGGGGGGGGGGGFIMAPTSTLASSPMISPFPGQ